MAATPGRPVGTPLRLDRAAAARHLRTADPVMRTIVGAVGRCGLKPGARGDHLTTLVRAIVGQQLSGKAAETIWQRFLSAYTDGRRVRPEDILALGEDELRAVGISTAKAASIRDLGTRVASGDLRLQRIARLADEDVIAELVRVRGIGRWTAEMFLMFKLGRADVWPVGDLGVRNAVARAYGIEPTPPALARIAEPWRPFRSAAAWYLWRSLDLETV